MESATYTVVVVPCDGNYRPYRAEIRDTAGQLVALTGFCKTPGRALALAQRMITALQRKAQEWVCSLHGKGALTACLMCACPGAREWATAKE